MRHILQLISDDLYIQHQAEQYLYNKWPQLNDRTRISYTNDYHIYVADLQPVNVRVNTIRVAISGWKLLRGVAMSPTLKRLDDPQERINYSHRLYSAIVRAPLYAFWRIAGALFKRSDWVIRGTEMQPSPSVNMSPVNRREIKLECFGWQMEYGRYQGDRIEQGYFICGYDNVNDTLYVYK